MSILKIAPEFMKTAKTKSDQEHIQQKNCFVWDDRRKV